MADFEICCSWMLDNEDPARAYAIVSDDPPGAHAISGINSAKFPQEYAAIAALPQNERGPAVEQFYQTHFWNKWIEQLIDNELAKRELDASVNMGEGTAVKCLQNALAIKADGAWGPITVSEANSEPNIVITFKAARLLHYKDIVAKNPSLAHYLGTAENPGPWWIRAMK